MYTTVWLRQSWMDNRLAWDPEEYGIQRLQLPVEELWTPDLSSYGGKLEVVRVSVYDKMTRAVVMADGKVVHVPAMKVQSKPKLFNLHSQMIHLRRLRRIAPSPWEKSGPLNITAP